MHTDEFAEILTKANEGDLQSMDQVALMYANGDAVDQDFTEAHRWFLLAIERGSINSMSNLGIRLLDGTIGKRDLGEAFILFQRVANSKLEEVCLLYASKLSKYAPVYLDFKSKFIPMLEKTQSMAMYNLGIMLIDGKDVSRDSSMGVNWLKRAVEKGCSEAAYVLGAIFWKGEGVAQDKIAASNWFKKAADMGNDQAYEIIKQMQGQNQ